MLGEKAIAAIDLQLAAVDQRLRRLTDALLDQLIDKETFEERKRALFSERIALREERERLITGTGGLDQDGQQKLELIRALSLTPEIASADEILSQVKSASSNLRVLDGNVVVDWIPPFHRIVFCSESALGAPWRTRTSDPCNVNAML